MKKILVIVCCFLFLKSFGQEGEKPSILINTKNWNKEIIKFPLDWAPKFSLAGFEELYFAPNWNKPESIEFWTLDMAWSIDSKSSLPQELITKNFTAYFEGLMKPNHWAKEFPEPKIEILKEEKNSNEFHFTMTFFDGFHTGKIIKVNIKANQVFCETAQRALITFHISPKDLNSKDWRSLEEITLNPEYCNPDEKANLIRVDANWTKEIFPFPIRFAKSIPYLGFEEARFPPKGWSDANHPNFWSYVFAWKIDLNKPITTNDVEKNLKIYFDGLSNQKDYKTTARFTLQSEENNTKFFEGKVTIFDNFRTKKPLTLNVIIECFLCNKEGKSTILFKFSPKEFTHKTWEMLEGITLYQPICN